MTVLSKCLNLTLAATLLAGLSLPAGAVDSYNPNGMAFIQANLLVQDEDWPRAVSLLRTIVADSPTSADANNLLGYALRKSGDHTAAEGFYLRALELNPRHRGAHEYLGELYVEIGQPEKAQELLLGLEQICGNTTCNEYRQLAEFIATKG